MLVSVRQIGDSWGVRLPEQMINALHIKESVDMRVSDNELILLPAGHPRKGWEDAFARMHTAREDRLLIPDPVDDDSLEWEW